MSQLSSAPIVANAVGFGLLASFTASNAVLSFMAIPAVLMPPAGSPRSVQSSRVSQPETNKTASSDALVSRQWKLLFSRGKASAPPLALLAASSLLYAALHLPESEVLSKRLDLIGAVLAVLVIPYTFTFMASTNNELTRRAAEAETADTRSGGEKKDSKDVKGGSSRTAGTGTGQKEDYYATAITHDLVLHWNMLNKIRALFPTVGSICVLAAIALSTTK